MILVSWLSQTVEEGSISIADCLCPAGSFEAKGGTFALAGGLDLPRGVAGDP